MSQKTTTRTRATPRAILLDAVASAITAGADERLVEQIWFHAFDVAREARLLAPAAGVDPDDAASAGLLHDLGELLLLAVHPTPYSLAFVGWLSHREQLTFEKRVFGTDHALVAAERLLDQRIPDVIADAVADHHDPFRGSDATTLVVAAADELVCGDPARRHALDLLGIAPTP
jgi:putative nucleotidyltransferase with HDIG domain